MSDQEDLDYYIMFPSFPPSPKDPTLATVGQDQREEFVFVYEEDKRPVVILLGWAGCQDRYLAKYSAIYEEKRYSGYLLLSRTIRTREWEMTDLKHCSTLRSRCNALIPGASLCASSQLHYVALHSAGGVPVLASWQDALHRQAVAASDYR